MAKKFYAGRSGSKTGIYEDWEECKSHSYNLCKKFDTRAEAEQFIADSYEMSYGDAEFVMPESCYAFTDGSTHSDANGNVDKVGYGVLLVDQNGKEHRWKDSCADPAMLKDRNSAGEVMGATVAIEKAMELGMTKLVILHDYLNIFTWGTGLYEDNGAAGVSKYIETCRKAKERGLAITFVHVKGHSGASGNDEVDRLANEAVGNC